MINERINITKKSSLGQGANHIVFAGVHNKNRVYKIVNDYSDRAHFIDEYKFMQKFPDFFPIIYKINDNYIELEKLDTNAKYEYIKLSDEVSKKLVLFYKDNQRAKTILEYAFNFTALADFFFVFCDSYHNNDSDRHEVLLDFEHFIENESWYKTYVKYKILLINVYELHKKEFGNWVIDINSGNFGYDKHGNLKMLDI